MATFHPTHVLSFDLETTSVNPHEARIVTSALLTINGSDVHNDELLADPGVEIPEAAQQVHGISTEYAREHGKPLEEVLAHTIEVIRKAWAEDYALIVFNAPYDLTVLRSLEPSFTVDGLVIDPLLLDRHFVKFREQRRTLESLAEVYGISLDNAHNASADALAAARIAWKQAHEWPYLTSTDADQLMVDQAVWYNEVETELEEYFRKNNRLKAPLNKEWPLQSAPTGS